MTTQEMINDLLAKAQKMNPIAAQLAAKQICLLRAQLRKEQAEAAAKQVAQN